MSKRFLVAAIVPVGLLFLAVYEQARAVNAGYEIEAVRQDINSLRVQRETLECDIARMKSPERLLTRVQETGIRFVFPVVPTSMVALGEYGSGASKSWSTVRP